MIGIPGTSIPDTLANFIATHNIGFVILFSRNIKTIPQVIELNEVIHGLGKIPPLVYTDQEGGTIVRFNEMAATAVSAMGIAATGSPQYAENAGRIIGEDMDICGVDGVFAPVLDVNIEEENPVIGNRSFSDQPEVVVEYAEQFCQGLKSAGILGCGKHYPGHGAAKADSHLGIPEIPLTHQDFMDYCYQPFEALARQPIDAMMTAHVLYPGITQDIATFSPYMIRDLLREKTGYNGVVFTDCLEMKAVMDNYTPEAMALKSVQAGIDVMAVSHTFALQEELLDILLFYTQKGVIEEKRIDETLARIFAMKSKHYPGLTRAGKIKTPEITPTQTRKNLALEREMAEHSVTLLKNNLGILPLEREKKTLVLEWTRSITGPSVSENEGQTTIARISGEILPARDHVLLNPGEPLPPALEAQFNNYIQIIACIYSRTGKIDHIQTTAIKKLLSQRKDAVIVSLENPYEIKKFPLADTFLVTYGFRKVQVEALFKILTGEISPTGKLPVRIGDLYSRGDGISY